jgi:hypothetical protein
MRSEKKISSSVTDSLKATCGRSYAGTPFPEHVEWGFSKPNRIGIKQALKQLLIGVGQSDGEDPDECAASAHQLGKLHVSQEHWRRGEAIMQLLQRLRSHKIRLVSSNQWYSALLRELNVPVT